MSFTKVPEMWKWRLAGDNDYIDTATLDAATPSQAWATFNPMPQNVANFGSGFGLYFMFVHFYAAEWLSIILVILLQFLWQVKNAWVPYMNYKDTSSVAAANAAGFSKRYFGGFGFCVQQEIYGAAGVLIAFLLDLIWPPAIQPSKAEEEANSF